MRFNFLHQLTVSRSSAPILAAADKVFIAICLALEAETLQGATASQVAESAKQLVRLAGIDANALLGTLSPETQRTVREYFAS